MGKSGVRAGGFVGLDSALGPAKPMTPLAAQQLVEQVVLQAIARAPAVRPRILSLRTLSLAAIVVVTSAAAATVVHHRYLSRTSTPNAQLVVTAELRSPRRAPPVQGVQSPAPSSESAIVTEPPTVAKLDNSSAQSSNAGATTNNVATTIPAKVNVVVADRLSAANELRRSGQWQAAESAYLQVASQYPSAAEAYVATLAAGALRLEHLGNPAGALELYRSLSQNNALGVEALFGVARCYRALGERIAELSALRSVIEAYPTSLQADRARERLRDLSSAPLTP